MEYVCEIRHVSIHFLFGKLLRNVQSGRTRYRCENRWLCFRFGLAPQCVICGGQGGTDTGLSANTVIPRLTSDPANEFFG